MDNQDPMARFNVFIARARDVEMNGVAPSSVQMYNSCLAVYAREMREKFGIDPYPLTLEKIEGYLAY